MSFLATICSRSRVCPLWFTQKYFLDIHFEKFTFEFYWQFTLDGSSIDHQWPGAPPVSLSLCHVAKVKYPNIDAFTSKTRLLCQNRRRDKGFVDLVRDPHISVFTPLPISIMGQMLKYDRLSWASWTKICRKWIVSDYNLRLSGTLLDRVIEYKARAGPVNQSSED